MMLAEWFMRTWTGLMDWAIGSGPERRQRKRELRRRASMLKREIEHWENLLDNSVVAPKAWEQKRALLQHQLDKTWEEYRGL